MSFLIVQFVVTVFPDVFTLGVRALVEVSVNTLDVVIVSSDVVPAEPFVCDDVVHLESAEYSQDQGSEKKP